MRANLYHGRISRLCTPNREVKTQRNSRPTQLWQDVFAQREISVRLSLHETATPSSWKTETYTVELSFGTNDEKTSVLTFANCHHISHSDRAPSRWISTLLTPLVPPSKHCSHPGNFQSLGVEHFRYPKPTSYMQSYTREANTENLLTRRLTSYKLLTAQETKKLIIAVRRYSLIT